MNEDSEVCTVGGETCKFPFIYNVMDDIPYVPSTVLRWFTPDSRFETCTDYQSRGRPWCATKVTSTNRYIRGHWGKCAKCKSGKSDSYNGNYSIYIVSIIYIVVSISILKFFYTNFGVLFCM